MKRTYLLAGLALLLVIACSRSERSPHAEEKAPVTALDLDIPSSSVAQEPPPSPRQDKADVGEAISSSAARNDPNDTVHHFIRTADLRFRVKDVVKATLGIEDIVGSHRGWVTETVLRSAEQGKDFVKVSEDSTLEIARYQVTNEMTLRVPNSELDSTLRQIGQWVDLFEQRTIHADDVRLRMMANAMSVRRAKAHALRVGKAITEKGSKLKETTAAEDAIMHDEEQADQDVLNNLDLEDRIDFSTVTLHLYERTKVRRELIANERSIEGYRPSLLSRVGNALRDGWRILEEVVVALLSVWPVMIVLGAVVLFFRRKLRAPNKG